MMNSTTELRRPKRTRDSGIFACGYFRQVSSRDTLSRIAEALGVSPDVLLGEEMSEKQARKRLYAVFSRFDGQMAEIDGKTLVWFNGLDLGAFYARYQAYKAQLAEAEKEEEPERREEKKKAARDSFEEWMELSGT